jgi:hypothetical protein
MNYPKPPTKYGDLWMMVVPVISSSHLVNKDVDTIFDHERCLLFSDDGTTAIIRIEEAGDWQDMSPETQAIINYFRERGYVYLRFDPTGDVLEGFPTFDW